MMGGYDGWWFEVLIECRNQHELNPYLNLPNPYLNLPNPN